MKAVWMVRRLFSFLTNRHVTQSARSHLDPAQEALVANQRELAALRSINSALEQRLVDASRSAGEILQLLEYGARAGNPKAPSQNDATHNPMFPSREVYMQACARASHLAIEACLETMAIKAELANLPKRDANGRWLKRQSGKLRSIQHGHEPRIGV